MSYSDKLKDPRWQKKRLEVLNRDNFTCKLCGDSETELHIHHVEYKGEPWEQDLDKLDTLCKHCHFCLKKSMFDYAEISGCSKKEQDEECVSIAFRCDKKSIVELIDISDNNHTLLVGRFSYSFLNRINNFING